MAAFFPSPSRELSFPVHQQASLAWGVPVWDRFTCGTHLLASYFSNCSCSWGSPGISDETFAGPGKSRSAMAGRVMGFVVKLVVWVRCVPNFSRCPGFVAKRCPLRDVRFTEPAAANCSIRPLPPPEARQSWPVLCAAWLARRKSASRRVCFHTTGRPAVS